MGTAWFPLSWVGGQNIAFSERPPEYWAFFPNVNLNQAMFEEENPQAGGSERDEADFTDWGSFPARPCITTGFFHWEKITSAFFFGVRFCERVLFSKSLTIVGNNLFFVRCKFV